MKVSLDMCYYEIRAGHYEQFLSGQFVKASNDSYSESKLLLNEVIEIF